MYFYIYMIVWCHLSSITKLCLRNHYSHAQLHFPLVCFFLCQLFVMAIMVMSVVLIAMFHVAQGGARMWQGVLPLTIFQIILGLCVLLQLNTMNFYPSLFCCYAWPSSFVFQFVMVALHCAFYFFVAQGRTTRCEKLHPWTFFYFWPLFLLQVSTMPSCPSLLCFFTKLLSFTFCSSWWLGCALCWCSSLCCATTNNIKVQGTSCPPTFPNYHFLLNTWT